MNYCALDDAFQSIGAPPGCINDSAAKAARKEERRKARRCKSADPQNTYDIPSMKPAVGLREQVTPDLEQIIPNEIQKELPRNIQNQSQVKYPGTSSWFGASIDESNEPFADYVPNSENYRLQPDFLSSFEQTGVSKAGSLPNTSMFWKPVTNGVQTAFTEPIEHSESISNNDIMKRLDKLWARLDDMNIASPEQITSEILMFISSGIFVLFMMDLLVKKGSTMRF